jgi:hypothetical protein
LLCVFGLVAWPQLPWSSVKARDDSAAPVRQIAALRMPPSGSGVVCSSCHLLDAGVPGELACRERPRQPLQRSN